MVCPVDDSLGFDTAFTLTAGTDASDTMCPQRDQDYWKIDLAAAQLLTVDISYSKLATMQLALDWYGPVGACMPASPPACGTDNKCADTTQVCDTLRGGCRRAAFGETCITNADCNTSAGEQCVSNREKLATVIEPTTNASQHRIVTAFASLIAGTYYLVVRDSLSKVADADVKYYAKTTLAANPDTNEPNDTKNLATTLTSGTQVEGYITHVGGIGSDASTTKDIDWYVINPNLGSQPVVTVTLTWPENSGSDPTFTMYQGTTEYLSSKVTSSTSGLDAINTRSITIVVQSASEPIFIAVKDNALNIDTDTAYQLTVSLDTDSSEATRNDTPDTAININLPTTPSSLSLNTNTLIAQNDQDWFKIQAAPNTNNSLIYMLLNSNADPDKDYILTITTFTPSTNTCTEDTDCVTGGHCITATNTCIVPWVQRPSTEGPGDFQFGGLSPNYIETQLPLFSDFGGVLYVLVTNVDSNPYVQGYSNTKTYSISFTHKAEPDTNGDLGTNPDNKFVVRPLQYGINRSAFLGTPRSVTIGSPTGTSVLNASYNQYIITQQGYISYEGDQDFFNIDVTGVKGSGLTLRISMPASSVDIRIVATRRSDQGAGIPSSDTIDDCLNHSCNHGGTCDTVNRHLCTQPIFDERVGPAEDINTYCVYVADQNDAGTEQYNNIQVWVNDHMANDWDEVNPYQFTIQLDEGCAPECANAYPVPCCPDTWPDACLPPI